MSSVATVVRGLEGLYKNGRLDLDEAAPIARQFPNGVKVGNLDMNVLYIQLAIEADNIKGIVGVTEDYKNRGRDYGTFRFYGKQFLPKTYQILYSDNGEEKRSKKEKEFHITKIRLIQRKLQKAMWFFHELDFDLETLDELYHVMKGNKKHFLWKVWRKLNRVLDKNPKDSFFYKKSLMKKVVQENKGNLLYVRKEDFEDLEDSEDSENLEDMGQNEMGSSTASDADDKDDSRDMDDDSGDADNKDDSRDMDDDSGDADDKDDSSDKDDDSDESEPVVGSEYPKDMNSKNKKRPYAGSEDKDNTNSGEKDDEDEESDDDDDKDENNVRHDDAENSIKDKEVDSTSNRRNFSRPKTKMDPPNHILSEIAEGWHHRFEQILRQSFLDVSSRHWSNQSDKEKIRQINNRNKKSKRKGSNGKKLKTKTEKIFHANVSATYSSASNNILSELFIQKVVKWFTNKDLDIWVQNSDISDVATGRFTRIFSSIEKVHFITMDLTSLCGVTNQRTRWSMICLRLENICQTATICLCWISLDIIWKSTIFRNFNSIKFKLL